MDDERRLTPTAAHRRARAIHRFRTEAVVLREAWRAAALRRSPERTGTWWTPAVDSLTRAIAETRDPRPACARLGRARAAAGMGVDDTLADLTALYRQLPAGEPSAHLVRTLCDSWTAVTLVPDHAAACVGTLPRLGSVGQLRAVLKEIARRACRAGIPLGNRHVLLVADLAAESPPTGAAEPPSAGAAMPPLPDAADSPPDGAAMPPPAGAVEPPRGGAAMPPLAGAATPPPDSADEPPAADPAPPATECGDELAITAESVLRARVATRFRATFPDGEPIIRLWPGGYVVPTSASAELAHRTVVLSRGLARIGVGTARLWCQDLPDDIPATESLFRHLAEG
ncbi:hypothetical protein GCM10022225_28950 [Plantactinospora mayteni]|uniref:DUF222 domain-containing protein n=1 Tax=Plantactinospora mayteni TaxID=566021 RepID=A0ABQ4ET67_9ACTN|nr:hypothetical protein [Plantactinospora mayteni]GIG97841.1 hypothetical protein Pma05_44140 [Plantactinospora mayteni]